MNTNIQTLVQKALYDIQTLKHKNPREIEPIEKALKDLQPYANDATTKFMIGTIIDAYLINAEINGLQGSVMPKIPEPEATELSLSIQEFSKALTATTAATPYKYLSNLSTKSTDLSKRLNAAYIASLFEQDNLDRMARYASALATKCDLIASNLDNPIYTAASTTLHDFSRQLNTLDQKIKSAGTAMAKASEAINAILSALPFLAQFFPFLS